MVYPHRGKFASSTLSGIAGFGGALVLLTFQFGAACRSLCRQRGVTAVFTHFTKNIIYDRYELITIEGIIRGSLFEIVMIAGSWTGKRVIHRISRTNFLMVVKVLLIISGPTCYGIHFN